MKFIINGKSFQANRCIKGILVDPKLPKGFDFTPNDQRPQSHQKFFGLPYIVSYCEAGFYLAKHTDEYAEQRRAYWEAIGCDEWFKAWPNGIRFDVHCLDGGAWDRPTYWGCFATLAEALECAKAGVA
jgi:hypothetical protein